jgi:diguanylate cyclase (GGDEF)-like protein
VQQPRPSAFLITALLGLYTAVAAHSVLAQPADQTLRRDLVAMENAVHREPAAVLRELRGLQASYRDADRETQAWYLLRRAQAHNALFMYEEFEQDIAEARGPLLSVASPELVLWLHTYAGIIEVRRGELKRGIEIFEDVAEQAEGLGADRVYVFAVQELAFTRGLLEQYDTSLQELQSAYAKALQLNQRDLLAMVNDAYGAVYAYMGDYPRSLEFYSKALRDFKQLGYREQTASAIQGLASTSRYAGSWRQAERYFNEYLEFTAYAPGDSRLFYGHYGLAMTFAEKGDCTRALPQIAVALEHSGPEDYDAELYKQQALCLAGSGEIAEAEAALGRAEAILAGMPELAGTSWMLALDHVRSHIEYHRGNGELAFELLDDFYQRYVQQMEKRSSNRMNMLRAGLESERKDLEIALLERQSQVNRLAVASQQQANQSQRYLVISSVALCLVVIAALLVQLRSNRRILALSHRDGLSGLYNRSYTFSYLDRVIPRITVEQGGLSIILLDIDNFKAINDNYGHPAGDMVIRQVANIGEASLRNRDIMGRIGGEEFLCVLPRATSEQCAQVAERLLRAINSETFTAEDGRRFTVSISIGIADYDPSIENADQLYSRADRALYKSKAAGKGRITAFHGALPAGA